MKAYSTNNDEPKKVETSEESTPKKKLPFGIIVAVLCIIFSLVNIANNNKTLSSLREKYAENEMQLDELKKSLNDSESNKSDEVTVKDVQEETYSAKKYGEKIAELETLLDYTNVEETEDELSNYISDGNMSWFSLNEPDKYEWKFNTTYDYNEYTIPVMWSYYAVDDTEHQHLIAYVTGKFDAKENRFSDINEYVTTYGRSLVGAD